MEQHKCEAKCFKDWAYYACAKTAKYHESGKWWCGTHAPSKVKERADKSREKWNKRREAYRQEQEEQDKREQRRDACESALAGIPDPEAAVKAAREVMLLDHVEASSEYTTGEYEVMLRRAGWDGDEPPARFRQRKRDAALALLNGTN